MMLSRFILCVLALCATIASGYVIKKRSSDGGNRLADALKVIQRERRRLKDIDEGAYDNFYYDQAADLRSPYAEPEPSSRYEDDTFLKDLFDHVRGEEAEMSNEEEPSVYGDSEENGVEVPVAAPPSEQKVDESELENIFDDEKSVTNDEKKQEDDKKDSEKKEKKEVEEKRTIPWQMGGPGGKPDKPDKKNEDKKDAQNDELTEEEVTKLLEDVEETEKENLAEAEAADEEEAKSNALPVSEDEIANTLNDSPGDIAEEDAPDAEYPSSQDEWEDVPTDQDVGISKEWLMNQYLQQPYSGAAKKKRSQNSQIAPEEDQITEEEDEEIVQTMEDCLREFIELEDDENTKLAQALNLATLGQVERTDKYIPDEVEYLKSAVSNEQRIKELRRCLRLGAEARGEFTSNEVESPARKRGVEAMTSQELMEEIPAQTQEADINDMLTEKLKQYLLRTAAGGNQQDTVPEWEEGPIDTDDADDILLNPYYRELMEQYNIQQERKRSEGFAEEGQFEDLTPLEEEELAEEEAEAEEPSNEEIEGALENYIEHLSPLEQEELKYEVEEALDAIPLTEADVCPAIEIYTDGCAYALELGLELDEEATDLCNRHQLCYTCGGEFGLSYKDCDKGYLEEADQLCEYDEECKNEAAGLYVVMARGHRYVQPTEVDATCRQQCVVDYIVGPDGDNL